MSITLLCPLLGVHALHVIPTLERSSVSCAHRHLCWNQPERLQSVKTLPRLNAPRWQVPAMLQMPVSQGETSVKWQLNTG